MKLTIEPSGHQNDATSSRLVWIESAQVMSTELRKHA